MPEAKICGSSLLQQDWIRLKTIGIPNARACATATAILAATCFAAPGRAIAQAMPETPRATMIQVETPGAGQQPTPTIRLSVPGVVLAAPASEVTFPIDVSPLPAVPKGAFVRLRGLPPTVAVHEGHAVAPGVWSVPVAAAQPLRMTVPAGAGGKAELGIALVTIDGVIIAEARASLIIAAAGLIAPQKEAAPPPAAIAKPPAEPQPKAEPPPAIVKADPAPVPVPVPQPPPVKVAPTTPTPPATATPAPPAAKQPASPPSLSPEVRARATGFMSRGAQLLKDGNIASSRLFFERAADEGLAEGALALGGTYDQRELQRLGAQGIRPDRDQARRWYEKARDLGSGEAIDRLRTL